MTKEKMLDKIDNVLLLVEDQIVVREELKEVRKALFEEIVESKCKSIKNGNIVNIINKQLKEIEKTCKSRLILANSVTINHDGTKYLAYTDSYYLIAAKYQDIFSNVINPQEELLKTSTYPCLNNLIPNYYTKQKMSFDKKELTNKSLQFIQNKKNHLSYSEETGIMNNRDYMLVKINTAYVDAAYIIKVCDVIGYDNLTVSYTDDDRKLIKIESDLGFGLVLPILTVDLYYKKKED